MDNGIKMDMLQAVYAVYGEWARSIPFACIKGCSDCCTQSVTMTSLEGKLIARYAQEGILDDFFEKNDATIKYDRCSKLTTNQFARRCLEGVEIEVAEKDSWQFSPCPFLRDKSCRIYPARPFGCRSFGSLVSCAATGSAEAPPLVITVNTVLMQIIEHIDQGRPWGNMLTVLGILHTEGAESRGNNVLEKGLANDLPVSEPIPGFLIPPDEQEQVGKVLADLYAREISGKPFRVWLTQCSKG